jgi:trimeric autotransporter adhesin
MAFIGNSLATPTILSLPATPIADSVSTTNIFDTYRFTLTQSSQVNLSLTGLGANANIALIKDTNANNLVDNGEVLASSTNLGSLAELVNQAGLAAGTYFVQVALESGTSTSYSLNLAATSQVQNDVIWRNGTTGDLGLWASNTTATTASYDRTLSLEAGLVADWKVEGTGDFNGDRVDDVLLRRTSDGATQIRFMSEAGVSSTSAVLYQGQSPLVGTAFVMAGTGDVNGDGKSDIIWRNEAAQSVVVWMMDGATVTPTNSGALTSLAPADFKINAIADFDQDGKADILWRNAAAGASNGQTVYWYLNPGSSGVTLKSPSSGTGLTVGMNFNLEGVGDFDADGKVDLLWRDTAAPATASNTIVWLMNGKNYTSAAFATPGNVGMTTFQTIGMRDQGNNKKSAAVLRDWNGDGKADVAWRNIVSGDIVVWQMNGVAIASGSVINDGVTGSTSAFSTARQAAGLVRRPRRLDEAGSTTTTALNVGALNGAGSYVGQVSGLDNEDWFQFTLGASTGVSLSLTGLTGNADLQLLNSTGGIIATSALTGTVNESLSQTLAAGTYFAKVYTTGNVRSEYSLGLNISGAKIVQDLTPNTADSNPSNFIQVGTTTYFTANSITSGTELWKTDGTVTGTVLVKDIRTGFDTTIPDAPEPYSSEPQAFASLGNTLFFTADDGVNGRELWKSDGTAVGTVLLKDIKAGTGSSSAGSFAVLGSSLYFAADDGLAGRELWKTDGTTAGTTLVKDITVGATGGSPSGMTVMNTALYFWVRNTANSYDLWKSDGSGTGTTLVKTFDASNTAPGKLLALGTTLYFAASSTVNGKELWKSDGTATGTVLVKDMEVGTNGSAPYSLAAMNGQLYFSAYTTANGRELWKSDGTTAGTVLLKDTYVGTASGNLDNLTVSGNTLYFASDDALNGRELWKSDGTATGTVLVKDIETGTGSSSPSSLTLLNGTVYFSANTTTNGGELWKTDGTATGTVLVKDISTGTVDSSPSSLFVSGTTLLFSAKTVGSGSELWKSDGTTNGTALVKDINLQSDSSLPQSLTNFQNTSFPNNLYFTANSPTTGRELYRSNGTSAGTVLVKDIESGQVGSDPKYLTVVGNTLYFSANTTVSGEELWKSDGTTAGTVLIKDIAAGFESSRPSDFTAGTSLLYFVAYDSVNGYELWKSDGIVQSDGTAPGTSLVKDIRPGSATSNPTNLRTIGNTVYFSATDGTNGYELWKSDGTTAGTAMLKDVNLSGDGVSGEITVMNGSVYFVGYNSTSGAELWKSDGTASGTILLKDINPGVGNSTPQYLTAIGNTLYFTAYDATNGYELWKSDGTATGTILVKNINPGATGSAPHGFVSMNGAVYFTAYDATNGNELWKTNGTLAGTTLVRDINSGTVNSDPGSLTVVGNTLFFSAASDDEGIELWRSDGTTAGTVLAKTIAPGKASSTPSDLIQIGGKIYFAAYDLEGGIELWTL